MKKVVLVTGLKGVGKTAVLSGIEGWKIINFGDIMMKLLEREGITRDDLQWKLKAGEYIELQKKAAKDLIIEIERSKENVIIDSHAIINTSFGLLPGFPLEILKELPLDMIVMIWARPEDIYARRLKDYYEKNRERMIISVEEIKTLQHLEENMCLIYSALKWVPFVKIVNAEGKLEEARRKLKEYLDRL